MTKFGGDPLEYARFVRAFDSHIASRTRDHVELMYYLEQYIIGAPKDLVRSCVHMSPVAGYMEARRKLDMRYGDPFLLAQSYLKKLDTWPVIRADDVKKLKEYTTFLVGCCNAMTSTDCIHQLDYPSSLQ